MKHLACLLLLLSAVTSACDSSGTRRNRFNRAGETEPIRELLQPRTEAPAREGIAAAVLIDTSGSMRDAVTEGGDPKPKILIAQEAVVSVLRQFAEYAEKNPEMPLLVGVYEFSGREKQPASRDVVPLGPPDARAAGELVKKMVPEGSTPIGDAMIAAKRELDATGMKHLHLLVVTDGENNRGFTPGDVAAVMAALPPEHQAGIYFIAFDTEAEFFNTVKDAGGLVLAAGNEADLRQTLDFILTGRILVERPVVTPSSPRAPHP